MTIGRADDADVYLESRSVSRRHACVTFDADVGWVLEDVKSTAGTYVGGDRIVRHPIGDGLVARFGDDMTGVALRLEPASANSNGNGNGIADPDASTNAIGASNGGPRLPAPGTVRIGRAPDNDIVVNDPLVSRYQAELRTVGGAQVFADLGSYNGSFVNGQRVVESPVFDGDRVAFGTTSFELRNQTLVPRTVRGGAVLRAGELVVSLDDGRRLLDGVSLDVRAGELVAVVGPTGSGKSTLLKVLTGSRPPDDGAIAVHGEALYESLEELRKHIGYVPQDDILHPQLTIRRELEYGAALRFPIDTSAEERRVRVDEVMSELGLTQRADVAIEKLSGGQRKRTNVALELLSRPRLLFLDEPTSGLDPGFEKSVMQLLRELATDGRAVVVVTHSVASLHLCDRILFLAAGGRTAFCGTPNEAKHHFGTADFADVFDELAVERTPVAAPASPKRAVVPHTPVHAPFNGREWRTHTSIMLRRQAAIWAADRRNFGFLAAEVLLPALLIVALVSAGSLRAGAQGGRTLLAAIIVSATAIGAANALREIVKEVPVYLRERAAGVSRPAYLTSKFISIGALTAVQCLLLVLIATARAGGPAAMNTFLAPRAELVLDVTLAAVGAVALGLLISSMVSSSEKAMALIAVVFVVEWLFAGVAIDLSSRPALQPFGYATTANWGMASAASTADLFGIEGSCGKGPKPAAPPQPPPQPGGPSAAPAAPKAPAISCDARWRAGTGRWLVDLWGSILLTAAALVGTSLALRRKEPRASAPAGRVRALQGRV